MTLITTWNPGYVYFTNPYEWGAFEVDLERFKRLIDGKLERAPRILPATAANVRHFYQAGWVAVDIETAAEHPDRSWTGKNPLRAKLKLLGLGNEHVGLSIHPTKHRRAFNEAKRLLADERVTKVFQNGDWFDLRNLAKHGIVVRGPIEDTRDGRRALSATSKVSLGYMASIYTDADPWKKGEDDDAKGLVFTDNLDDLRKYNAKDCVYTARVQRGIERDDEWNSPRVQRLYAVHRELSRIGAEMHTHGIPVDYDRFIELRAKLRREYRVAAKKFIEAVNMDGMRCNDNDFRALVYASHAKGKYAHLARFNLDDPQDPAMYTNEDMATCAVNKDALIQLLIDPSTPDELREFIKLFWDAREIYKQLSTFVASKKVAHAIGNDWYLRPGWNTCGTETGRWSCSEPNAMNIVKSVRWMYAARPGRMLIGADWAQMELRIRRAITGDEVLGAALDDGDVYSADARDWFGIPEDVDIKEKEPKIRKGCKIMHLGCQYGAGAATVHKQALKQDRNFQWALTKTLHDKFQKRYHPTVTWWEEEHKRVKQCGYSETALLQRRRVYPAEPPPTETSNYPIQGTAGDLANLSIIEADRRLKAEVKDAHLIIQLHDALYVDCREGDVERVKCILKDTMEVEHRIQGKVWSFPTDITSGISWDEL